jgi:hypothetical protein
VAGFPVTDNRRMPIANKFFEKLPVTDPHAALAASAAPVEKYDPSAAEYKPSAVAKKEEIPFDLAPLRLYWGEFLQRHSVHADMAKWLKEFKTLLPQVPKVEESTAFTVDGTVVATYHRDAALNVSRLKAEQPELYHKYMRRVSKIEFDKEAFALEEPAMNAAYRSKRLGLVRRSGITLAHLVQ